jgi:hypothetical protein
MRIVFVSVSVLCLVAAGCSSPEKATSTPPLGTDTSGGLLGSGPGDPFPSALLVDAEGRLALDTSLFGGAFDPSPVNWRRGFSPVQGGVVSLDGVDPAALPTWSALTPGAGGVIAVDLDSGEFIPVHAELDGTGPAADEPLLLIQPKQPMADGHRVAFVVTTDAAPRPARFEAILNGTPPADFEGGTQHIRDLVEELSGHGIAADSVALAWDFPVDAGTAPLASGLAQLAVPETWDFHEIREEGSEGELHNDTWRYARARLEVQDFLVDDWHLNVDADGAIAPTGTTESDIFAVIPRSVVEAGGARGVLFYGHGAGGHPSYDLNTADYKVAATVAAEENRLIILATTTRGLEYNDFLDIFGVTTEPERFLGVAHRVVQGQLNTRALIRAALEGDLLDDPVFEDENGVNLASTDTVFYYGMSLGSFMGTGMMGTGFAPDAAVLAVGGAGFGWTLPRLTSQQAVGDVIVPLVPGALDRQRAWGLWQLGVDPVEPSTHAGAVSSPVLLTENMGDDDVRNGAAEHLARALGASLVEPAHREPWGVPPGSGGPWLFQYDPELGASPMGNAPPPQSNMAHYQNEWPGALEMVTDFLDPDSPGALVFPCGDAPCSASNDGGDGRR